MSTGDTRRSQSATIFNKKYNTNHGNKPPSKHLREEDNNSVTLNSEASTVALIVETLKNDQNFLIIPIFTEPHKEQQATNLNHLNDENAQYECHRQFLLQSIESKLTTKV